MSFYIIRRNKMESPLESVPTRITHVTIYRDGALIRRTGILPENGDSSLKISCLPLSLNDSSVRAGLIPQDGSRNADVKDLRVVLELPEEESSGEGREREAWKSAQKTVRLLQNELESVNESIGRLQSMDWPSRPVSDDPGKINESALDARIAYASHLSERIEKSLSRRRDLTKKLKDALLRQNLLYDRVMRAGDSNTRRKKALRKAAILSLNFHGEKKPGTELFLEYFILGARWAPSYSLDFTSDFSESVMKVRAVVCQNSGEDWTGVKIRLSTAEASGWIEMPRLGSRRIGRAVPRQEKSGWREMPPGVETLFEDFNAFRKKNMAEESPDAFGAPIGGLVSDELPEEYIDEESYEEMEDKVDADIMEMSAPMSMMEDTEEPPEMYRSMKKSKKMMAPSPLRAEKQHLHKSLPPGAPAEEACDSGADVNQDLLDYGALRMRAPGESSDSALVHASRRERYKEMLGDVDSRERGLLLDRISSALERSSAAAREALPAGCSTPAPLEGFDSSIDSAGTVSVRSDGVYHSIGLFEQPISVSISYVTVPREDSSVYRRALFQNSMPVPLLSGPVDVSAGSDFLLTTSLETLPAGANAQLGLGVEEGIKVSRNTQFEEITSGLAGGTLSLRHEINLELINNLTCPAAVEVRERIPTNLRDQSRIDEKVKIRVESSEPEWRAFEQDENLIDGGYCWSLNLDPSEKVNLQGVYKIDIPSNHEISGGNNREAGV